jgi:enamine deaminase RidA (YjgF/YER057c/UK114 family)
MLVLTSAGTAMSQERFPDPPPAHGLYSDAVRVGDLVLLSGVVSGDPDPAQQFRGIFERIDRILQEAGSGLDQIVDMTTYHVDMHEHIDAFIEVTVIAAVGDGG